MPKILIADPIADEGLELLRRRVGVDVKVGLKLLELLDTVGDYDALVVRSETKVTAEVIKAGNRLRVIARAGIGVDNIDLDAATTAGIAVVNAPTGNTVAAAEHTLALMLALSRNIPNAHRSLKDGEWRRSAFIGTEVRNKTLGIVGLGQIGLEMAKRARGFDMKVVYYSRTRKPDLEERYGLVFADPPTVLSTADFISLHVPLTPETRHFISEREIRMMKPTAILINMARGPVVDSKALYTALSERWIRAAALDVTDPEPISPDDPLLTLDNIIITPHIGSASIASRREMCLVAARNLVAGLKGERLEHCANPELYPAKGL